MKDRSRKWKVERVSANFRAHEIAKSSCTDNERVEVQGRLTGVTHSYPYNSLLKNSGRAKAAL